MSLLRWASTILRWLVTGGLKEVAAAAGEAGDTLQGLAAVAAPGEAVEELQGVASVGPPTPAAAVPGAAQGGART